MAFYRFMLQGKFCHQEIAEQWMVWLEGTMIVEVNVQELYVQEQQKEMMLDYLVLLLGIYYSLMAFLKQTDQQRRQHVKQRIGWVCQTMMYWMEEHPPCIKTLLNRDVPAQRKRKKNPNVFVTFSSGISCFLSAFLLWCYSKIF